MTRALWLASVVVLGACTHDVHLGAHACGTAGGSACPCDPLAGADCPCTDTAECPDPFYCLVSNAGGTCRPPAGCIVTAGGISCGGTPCEPNTPACMPPTCNANTCASNSDTCCPSDFRCYPTNCAGCCQ